MDSDDHAIACQALLVVDVQRGFVDGPGAVPGHAALLAAIGTLLARARAADAPVIFLQNDGPAGAIDEAGTAGWALYFAPRDGEHVVRKCEDDGFAGTRLDTLLEANGVCNVAICGVLSEMCVAATARAAEWSLGDEIHIVSSAADVVFTGRRPRHPGGRGPCAPPAPNPASAA